jgi:glycosyltransferase involved in cell wall biosynthesis
MTTTSLSPEIAGSETAPATDAPVVLHARVVTGTGGGPEKTILNSPRFLTPHNYRALCGYMHPPGDPGFDELRRRAAELEAPLLSIPDRGVWDLSVARQMLAICRRERVAVWHGHDYKSNALGVLLRRFHPMRLVTTVHGWGVRHWKSPIYHAIDRLSLRRYDRVVCVSDDLVETCLASGVRRERCVLIENAIDTEQFRRTRSVQDAKLALDVRPERCLIGAVGRLSAEKGFDQLIHAVAQLVEAGHDVELAIAGDGDCRKELEALIAKQREPERYRLLGHVSNVIPLFEAMDVFALSSLREGLPNVVLEAMALDVPIVATRIGGVPKLIDDEQNGLLVPPGEPSSLAAALGRLLKDERLRQELADAGRATIESRFSFSVRMAKIRAVYDEVLKG